VTATLRAPWLLTSMAATCDSLQTHLPHVRSGAVEGEHDLPSRDTPNCQETPYGTSERTSCIFFDWLSMRYALP
jgi:hypothetical protein